MQRDTPTNRRLPAQAPAPTIRKNASGSSVGSQPSPPAKRRAFQETVAVPDAPAQLNGGRAQGHVESRNLLLPRKQESTTLPAWLRGDGQSAGAVSRPLEIPLLGHAYEPYKPLQPKPSFHLPPIAVKELSSKEPEKSLPLIPATPKSPPAAKEKRRQGSKRTATVHPEGAPSSPKKTEGFLSFFPRFPFASAISVPNNVADDRKGDTDDSDERPSAEILATEKSVAPLKGTLLDELETLMRSDPQRHSLKKDLVEFDVEKLDHQLFLEVETTFASTRNPWQIAYAPERDRLTHGLMPWEAHRIEAGDSLQEIRLWVGTWNLHGKLPKEDLRPFLDNPMDPSPFHIVAIGTQECERPIGQAVILPSKDKWQARLRLLLRKQYKEIHMENLAALHLALFVRKDLRSCIHGVESGHVATGIGNVVGNKGGLSIGIQLYGISLLFVTCHFQAHQQKVFQRNRDFHRINEELALTGFAQTTDERMTITNLLTH